MVAMFQRSFAGPFSISNKTIQPYTHAVRKLEIDVESIEDIDLDFDS